MQFIYETSPIDHFPGLVTVDQYVKNLVKDGEYENDIPFDSKITKFLQDVLLCAFRIAKSENSNWEGDTKDIHVFSIPDAFGDGFLIGLVFKQQNNGITFICSPVPFHDKKGSVAEINQLYPGWAYENWFSIG